MFNRRLFYTFALLSFLIQTQERSLSSSRSITSRSNLGKRDDNDWPSWWSRIWQGGFWSWFHNQDLNNNLSNVDSSPHTRPSEESSSQGKTGWTWSSKDGYRPGKGDPPPKTQYENTQGGGYGTSRNVTQYNGPQIPSKGSEIQGWLKHHNSFRARYGARPLTWSPKMVAASKRLTDTCVWKHTQNNQFGENMSAGQTSIQEVVEGWVTGPGEKDSYRGGDSEPSHFTQVVWLSTTQVGCYHTVCKDVSGANLPQSPVPFWACNYHPAGNVIGQFEQNVKAKPGGDPM